MRKRLVSWLLVAVCASSALTVLRGELSDEEKKRLFLRAREDIRPVPQASATPRPKPRTDPTPRPKATPGDKPTPRKTTPEPGETPSPRKPTPKPKSDEEEPDRTPRSTPTPAPEKPPRSPEPTPKPSKEPADRPAAPILIEKSGLQDEKGYEPPPEKSSGGGWFKRYRYLTPSVRRAIDGASVQKGRWKYVIIHNSGTRQGNARIFDTYHRRVRKMQNGLAYHFVVGNGNSSGDGEIEIGPRWTRQLQGGHVASNYLNQIAIGICLVGDLNRDEPTKAQLAALEELTTYLRKRVGKVKGRQAIVVPHKKINPKPTDCPGDRFPYRWLNTKFGS